MFEWMTQCSGDGNRRPSCMSILERESGTCRRLLHTAGKLAHLHTLTSESHPAVARIRRSDGSIHAGRSPCCFAEWVPTSRTPCHDSESTPLLCAKNLCGCHVPSVCTGKDVKVYANVSECYKAHVTIRRKRYVQYH